MVSVVVSNSPVDVVVVFPWSAIDSSPVQLNEKRLPSPESPLVTLVVNAPEYVPGLQATLTDAAVPPSLPAKNPVVPWTRLESDTPEASPGAPPSPSSDPVVDVVLKGLPPEPHAAVSETRHAPSEQAHRRFCTPLSAHPVLMGG